MTFIPGTTPVKNENVVKGENGPQASMIVNVDEMIESKKVKDPEEAIWYLKLKYWLLFGLAIASIFVFLSIINKNFLIFAPLWPFILVISWFVRRIFVNLEGKNKPKP